METQLDHFAQALHPDRWRCLGRTLRPLTVGHILLLARLGHPLVTGQGIYDAAAVGQAVAICTRSASWAATLIRWGILRWLMVWLGLVAAFHPKSRIALLSYIVEGCRRPRWWVIQQADAAPSGVPLWASIYALLQREYRRTAAGAFNTPAREALWLAAIQWEIQGSIRVESDEEARLKAEIVAEGNGGQS